MNTKNNKRRRGSVEKIETAFIGLLQTEELKDITVSQLCQLTGLNRSTFYANFSDIYDLAEQLRLKMEADFAKTFSDEAKRGITGATMMFRYIQANQPLFRVYFKLEFDQQFPLAPEMVFGYWQEMARGAQQGQMKYRVEFFRHGINAMIKLWLTDGCVESPEWMTKLLEQEYRGRLFDSLPFFDGEQPEPGGQQPGAAHSKQP